MVVTSPLPGMASYVELDTVCSVEDLYNMLEIIDAKEEYDELARIKQEQQAQSQQ